MNNSQLRNLLGVESFVCDLNLRFYDSIMFPSKNMLSSMHLPPMSKSQRRHSSQIAYHVSSLQFARLRP